MKILNKESIIVSLESNWQAILDWCTQHQDKDFNEPLAKGKWSIAQTLYHLAKITRHMNRGLKMPKLVLLGMFGKNKRVEKTYVEIVEHFSNLMSSGGISPAQYVAEKNRVFEKEILLKRFSDELKDLKAYLEKWDDKSMSQYVLPHPGLDKITIREILFYTIWHTNHHLVILQKQTQISLSS